MFRHEPLTVGKFRYLCYYNVRESNPEGARFSARPDRSWGPPSLLYIGYRVFPGGKVRPGRAAVHSPHSSAEVLEEYSYTSTPLWATTGPVTALLYLTCYYNIRHLRNKNAIKF
jgi:hypothetical protein